MCFNIKLQQMFEFEDKIYKTKTRLHEKIT